VKYLVLVFLPLTFAVPAAGELYIIAGADTVFTGADFTHYDTASQELRLSVTGQKRCAGHAASETHDGREIPKLSGLTGKLFVLEVDGEVLAEGHFSSMASSCMHTGLVLWDTLIRPGDETLRLTYHVIKDEPQRPDPRESNRFLDYFASRGKLVD